jgi:hypothetical protein
MAPTAAGFALFRESWRQPEPRRHGDIFGMALAAVPAGGHVDLFAYSNEAAFSRSQAFRDGLTMDEHLSMLYRLKGVLEANGRNAHIKWVSIE